MLGQWERTVLRRAKLLQNEQSDDNNKNKCFVNTRYKQMLSTFNSDTQFLFKIKKKKPHMCWKYILSSWKKKLTEDSLYGKILYACTVMFIFIQFKEWFPKCVLWEPGVAWVILQEFYKLVIFTVKPANIILTILNFILRFSV